MRALRRFVALIALVAASAAISQWRPTPTTPSIALAVSKMVPPIFVGLLAAPPTQIPGCTGTPVSPTGKLAITMKNFILITSTNTEVSLFSGSATLDFAQNSGATVGDFVSSAVVPNGTYTKLKATMGSTLSVKGSITCAGQTYVTNGSSSLTSADPIGAAAAAVESNYTINGGVDQTFTLTLPSPVTVGSGDAKSIGLFFNNTAALQLWDLSPLTGNPADRKILPGGGGPSKAQ